MTPRHAAALEFAKRGIPIFPCIVGGKAPATEHGFKNRSTNIVLINHWWSVADYNIGVCPADMGLAAIDLDLSKRDGVSQAMLDLLPATRTHRTPSAGEHRLYCTFEAFGNRTLAVNVDGRSANGYILWPPSVVNGREYTVEDDREPVMLPKRIADAWRSSGEKTENFTIPDDGVDKMLPQAREWAARYAETGQADRFVAAAALVRNFGLTNATATKVAEEAGLRMLSDTPGGTTWEQTLNNARKFGHGELGKGVAWSLPEIPPGIPPEWEAAAAALPRPAARFNRRTPEEAAGPHKQRRGVQLIRGDLITPTKINWLWNGWLALGKYHVLAGPKGAGKSTLIYSLAATISVGGEWPDGTQAPIGDCLIWSAEDDFQDTILPRFMAAGGDRNRLIHVAGVPDGDRERPFDPARDIPHLQDAVKDLPDLRLIIVDPVVMAVAGDSHKNAETRRGLQPLVNLAERAGAALIGITHFSKGTDGKDPVERITGSLAFGALARVAFAATAGEDGQPRKFVRTASNIGPTGDGFEYSVRQDPVPGHDMTAQRILWGKSLRGSPRSLLEKPREPNAVNAAEAFIAEQLKDGPVPVVDLTAAAKAHGLSWRTIERAKAAMPFIKAVKAAIQTYGDRPVWQWVDATPDGLGDILR